MSTANEKLMILRNRRFQFDQLLSAAKTSDKNSPLGKAAAGMSLMLRELDDHLSSGGDLPDDWKERGTDGS